MATLMSLQRIAKCDTLDSLIADGIQAKQKKKAELMDTTSHLRKLRKRKANVMLALAGMTPQKLEDMKASFAAKEARREERKAASAKKKVKIVMADQAKEKAVKEDKGQASSDVNEEEEEEAAQESALTDVVTEEE